MWVQVFKQNIHMKTYIHNRIEHIIDSERHSISAFEHQIVVCWNSISTSMDKKSSVSYEVIRKIHNQILNHSEYWNIFGNENESEVEIKKLSVELKKFLIDGKTKMTIILNNSEYYSSLSFLIELLFGFPY